MSASIAEDRYGIALRTNVSAVQLRKADFVATVDAALCLGADPHGIDMEITESLPMEGTESTLEKLRASTAGIQLTWWGLEAPFLDAARADLYAAQATSWQGVAG